MNGVKENKGIKQYVVPVLAASAIMVLVLLTIPTTGIPATVRGVYGGGGGGGSTIVTIGFTVPDVIVIGTPGTIAVVISGQNASTVDIKSITFAGAPVESWSYDANGNLVLVFDKSKLNLKPGDTSATLKGELKNGAPFGGAAPVTVVQ